jgi:hypothetical protein
MELAKRFGMSRRTVYHCIQTAELGYLDGQPRSANASDLHTRFVRTTSGRRRGRVFAEYTVG